MLYLMIFHCIVSYRVCIWFYSFYLCIYHSILLLHHVKLHHVVLDHVMSYHGMCYMVQNYIRYYTGLKRIRYIMLFCRK